MPTKMENSCKCIIIKVSNVEDESTGEAYEKFSFSKTCNRKGTLIVPRDEADDPKKLYTLLKLKNADLPANEEKALALIKAAIARPPRRHTLLVRHVGWRRNRKTFVIGRRVIDTRRGTLRKRPPLWLDDNPAARLRVRGTVDGWKRQVARPARYSSVLRLGLSASCAAPLVSVSGMQNFAFDFFGRAKVGKSTLLLAATSLYGIGLERDLPNWNTTSGAFMEIARGYNDCLLPGNELSLIDGKKRDAYAVIRNRIYSFSEGRDRSRMAKTSLAAPRGSDTYRGIAIYTAEFSFEDYAAQSGEERSPGEYARAFDIPAARPGHSTIFDRYPRKVPRSKRKEWVHAEVIKLRRACEQQHGAAIGPYIKFLIALGDKLPGRVSALSAEFIAHIRPMKLDPPLEHAAKNFALVYAGGCLGIDAGILPWSRKHTLADVLTCFKAGLAVIRGQENVLDIAKRRLSEHLAAKDVIRFRPSAKFGPGDYPGYYEVDGTNRKYTIHAAKFRTWFDSPVQCAAIVHWLSDEGHLITGSRVARRSPSSTEWAERMPRWPDGNAQRSFTFRDPFKTNPKA